MIAESDNSQIEARSFALPKKIGVPLARTGIKKWFMLQIWRVQQVAAILTLALMALNLALQVFGLIRWREDSPLSTSWIGVPMILMLLAMVIWTFAIFWDLRLKMWRDQATVLVERNPYSKEKMSSKELAFYAITWLPIMEKMGKDDPQIRAAATGFKEWMRKAYASDSILRDDLNDLKEHMGLPDSLLDFRTK